MIATFLRPPRAFADWAVDGVRLIGLVSVIAAAIWWQATDAGVVTFALPALCVPRFLGMRPAADIVTGVVVLVAAWGNVLDLYTTVPGRDVPSVGADRVRCAAVLRAHAAAAGPRAAARVRACRVRAACPREPLTAHPARARR